MTGHPLRLAAPAAAACLAAMACGGGIARLQSRPAETPMTVDADQSEWWGSLIRIHKHLSIGVRNDADYLYLSLMADEDELADQILAQGLIVWFDPKGQKAQSFGIRFPLGLTGARPGDSPPGSGPPRSASGGAGIMPGGKIDSETRAALRERSMSGARVLTASDTVRVESGSGIDVEGRAENGRFVYELKVPLREGPGRRYAIGAGPGDTIGIGFVTPETDPQYIPEPAVAEAPGGASRQPPPGGFGVGPPGGRGGPGVSLPSPLEEWVSVTLAPAAVGGD